MRTYTLKREIRGGGRDGIAPGKSIPSHLRAGLYHDEGYSCPESSGGCSVDVDNVQVVRPFNRPGGPGGESGRGIFVPVDKPRAADPGYAAVFFVRDPTRRVPQ
jgi:hypothetical protein